MTTRDDILERLSLAASYPWGPIRSSLTAEAVAWADALGDEGLAIDARLALSEAYRKGNEEWRALAPFVWVLARHEVRPDLFDADRLRATNLKYAWAVPVAADNPGMPAARLRELVSDMEEFHRARGGSMRAVHAARHHVARMLGLEEEAQAELAAWRAAPRDPASEREGCDSMPQVVWASLHEDWQTAVAAAVPALRGDIDDSAQPHRLCGAALVALFASGRPRAAWRAHVSSYRSLRTDTLALDYLPDHLEYLALSGRVGRGLKVLREFGRRIGGAGSARTLMRLLLGTALVLREAVRAGRGEEPLGFAVPVESVWCPGPGIPASTPLREARELAAGWARAVAARYDRRNGNAVVSDRLERRLNREPITGDEEITARGALAAAGVELMEPGEELPEALRVAAPGPDDGAAGPDAAGVGRRAGAASAAGAGSEPASGPTAPAPDDGATAPGPGRTGTSLDDEPCPAVDLRAGPVPAGTRELLARFDADLRRPGQSLEHGLLVARAVRLGYEPDPLSVDPALAEAARVLRLVEADLGWDHERAVEEAADLRARIDAGARPLDAIRADLAVIRVRRQLGERGGPAPSGDGDSLLERARELARRLTGLVEPVLAAPRGPQGREEDEAALVSAYGAATALVRILPELRDHDGADEALGLARRIAPRIEHLVDARNGALSDQLDAARAFMLLERGDLYGACAQAEKILRWHDPCPFVLADDARTVLARASTRVGETEEAVVQTRAMLDNLLAAGMDSLAGPLLGSLAAALGSLGRDVEAAEVLEAALDFPVPAMIAEELRDTLITVLDRLGEESAVRDACLELAEARLERGRTESGLESLVRGAEACQELDENLRAAQLFERAARLIDDASRAGRVRRSRLLRRSARAVVDARSVLLSRTRLDEARALMARARELIETVPDSRQYSAAFEMGDWHNDMAWVLWRAGECDQALEHCERAYEGCMSVRDRSAAARPLVLAVVVHMELGDVQAARAAIARARRLLGHRRRAGHPMLARLDQLEVVLDAAR